MGLAFFLLTIPLADVRFTPKSNRSVKLALKGRL